MKIYPAPELEPVTFQAKAEKHKLLVFVENQCIYCSYVVKNIKKYTDAGLTMSFVTVVPSSIKDSVIEDMGRVWCAPDRQKSFKKEGANKQVISSQADSLIKISRIWADFFPANTSNQPI